MDMVIFVNPTHHRQELLVVPIGDFKGTTDIIIFNVY